MIAYIYNSGKCQLIYSDRDRTVVVLGQGRWWKGGEKDYKEVGGNLGGDGYVHYFDCGDGFMGVYLYLKTDQILNLNMCSSLYINYTLVKKHPL